MFNKFTFSNSFECRASKRKRSEKFNRLSVKILYRVINFIILLIFQLVIVPHPWIWIEGLLSQSPRQVSNPLILISEQLEQFLSGLCTKAKPSVIFLVVCYRILNYVTTVLAPRLTMATTVKYTFWLIWLYENPLIPDKNWPKIPLLQLTILTNYWLKWFFKLCN